MEVVAKTILEFLIIFLIIYFGYYIFNYRKMGNYNRKKAPVNIKYLVFKYKLDIVKIGYKRVFKSLMISDAFIVSFVFTITKFMDDNIYIRLITCFILIFPLFAGVYHLVAIYYIKESE